ncbi:MAG: mycofactocin biosynthesis peptidyl-dipeptidase MftE [Acidimicrobiaceae bacterium]|nr:mycofactocin biosynthesis peptidyl-dipeptidase MftE [Acidimicrobiaceae bacterium]
MASLGSCTSAEIAAAGSETAPLTLLLPLGSTEQHGPHLPLDTDTRIAQAVADGVALRLDSVRVAPAISITASDEHLGFAGTLTVGTRVLSEMLIEIVGNAGPEFGRIVAVNGHGGNAYALRAATEVCKARGQTLEVWSVRLPGADAHAGRTETSLMLAIAEGLVRLDLAEAGAVEPLDELLPKIFEAGVREVSANGVLGDPSGANPAEGTRLLAGLIDDAVNQLTSG